MASLVRKSVLPFLLFLCQGVFSQTYTLNGSAAQNSCNCYTLTTETMNQSGSVWNNGKIDVSQPFDFKFNVFLGCGDSPGADGIAFILQTKPNSIGRNGSGLGFAGVPTSIGIALDTYQNTDARSPENDLNDPYYDHISIQANGIVKHGNDLANPVTASATSDNIEDCNWHVLRITWNPAAKEIQAFFDGVFRVGATVDLVNGIFGSTSSSVYWGFSASTGGEVNVQKFCTALNPGFTTNLPANGACIGAPVSFEDSSLSFAPIAEYYWDFGDGVSSTVADPASHQYSAPGVYPVRLAITGLDGCKSDTLQKTITIGSVPDAAFAVTDACFKTAPVISFANNNIGVSYQWLIDGTEISREAQPQLTEVAAGSHTLERRVVSDFGCGTDVKLQPLTIKPIPVVEPTIKSDVCINIANTFAAQQQDNSTMITAWNWIFGDGQKAVLQNAAHTYKRAGAYTANLWAIGANGCASDTMETVITVHEAHANAGSDTIVLNSVPFNLSGTGNGAARWFPSAGLNRDDILTPVGTLTNDQQYELTVTTTEGCLAKDSVKIEVFKGSAVYVPTAFTPNSNGLNDLLKPGYIGIKKLHYFTIYNRWGQAVFSTTNISQGWDGKQKGKPAGTGSFVWMLSAEDIVGKVYKLKGTFVLIR